ncbi:MAG TPA: hypothetical protein VH394_25785 [Thermoanaerobaculia bacterium]|jgi:hypothetical protein|nr:hypothetical protein [Thermoanaerobaculia bacterium]
MLAGTRRPVDLSQVAGARLAFRSQLHPPPALRRATRSGEQGGDFAGQLGG